MVIEISNKVVGKVKCVYNNELIVFDCIDDIEKDERLSKLQNVIISAEENMVVLTLSDFVPISPQITGEEEWVKSAR